MQMWSCPPQQILLHKEKTQASFMIWPLGASTNEAPALPVQTIGFINIPIFLQFHACLLLHMLIPGFATSSPSNMYSADA